MLLLIRPALQSSNCLAQARLSQVLAQSLSGGGGGSGAAPLTDDLERLNSELEKIQQIIPLQKELNQAKLDGNKADALSLQAKIDLVDLVTQQADEMRGLNTEEGKALQQQINALEVEQLMMNYESDKLQLLKAQAQAREDALAPLEQQRGLLEAKLNGTEKEYRLQQEIDRIKKQRLS